MHDHDCVYLDWIIEFYCLSLPTVPVNRKCRENTSMCYRNSFKIKEYRISP